MPATPTSDLYMVQGADFNTIIELDMDLTGMRVYCVMATSYYTANKIPLDVTVTDVLTGQIQLGLDHAVTKFLKGYKRYVFTIMVETIGDIPYPVLQGVVIVDPSTVIVT